MKNLLAEIARQLVDYPEQVKVNEIDGDHTLVLDLSVSKLDIGKMIGKKGREKGSEHRSHPNSHKCSGSENTQTDYR